MHCRVCGQSDLSSLWFGFAADGSEDRSYQWFRCLACGSDTSSIDPAAVAGDYQSPCYIADHCGQAPAPSPTDLGANVRWFNDYRGTVPGVDFLDVGCLNGAALDAMHADGWRVHGFDINPHAARPGCTTIAPVFVANLFPRNYDVVLCREVVEHVEAWRHLIAELFQVTKPQGLCQVQTPRPCSEGNGWVYHRHHVQLHSVSALELELRRVGFEVQDRWLWPRGQAWLVRRP